MFKLLIRLAINAVALWVVINGIPGVFNGVPGISGPREWQSILALAFIFGLVNAIIRPIITLLTCPLIILTLGLGTLLVNTLMFYLAGQIGTAFGVGFTVDGFWPAFFGALIVSIISIVLSVFVPDDNEGRRWRKKQNSNS
ncbi:MAG: phage holin family protein [Anaerolineales bacterium]|nr:phage holin family protein [Anaerolineales bacterium]